MMEDDDKHDFKPLERVPGCLTTRRHGQRSEPQTQSEASLLCFRFSCRAQALGGFKEVAALALVPSTFTKHQGETWVTFKARQRQDRMEWMWASGPENQLIFLARVLGRLNTLSETHSSRGKSHGGESDRAKWWPPQANLQRWQSERTASPLLVFMSSPVKWELYPFAVCRLNKDIYEHTSVKIQVSIRDS